MADLFVTMAMNSCEHRTTSDDMPAERAVVAAARGLSRERTFPVLAAACSVILTSVTLACSDMSTAPAARPTVGSRPPIADASATVVPIRRIRRIEILRDGYHYPLVERITLEAGAIERTFYLLPSDSEPRSLEVRCFEGVADSDLSEFESAVSEAHFDGLEGEYLTAGDVVSQITIWFVDGREHRVRAAGSAAPDGYNRLLDGLRRAATARASQCELTGRTFNESGIDLFNRRADQ